MDQVECQFPFKYQGETYNKCTLGDSDGSGDGSDGDDEDYGDLGSGCGEFWWCATELAEDGTMIDGQWGICDLDSCTDDAVDTTEESFKVESTTLGPTTETESSILDDNEDKGTTFETTEGTTLESTESYDFSALSESESTSSSTLGTVEITTTEGTLEDTTESTNEGTEESTSESSNGSTPEDTPKSTTADTPEGTTEVTTESTTDTIAESTATDEGITESSSENTAQTTSTQFVFCHPQLYWICYPSNNNCTYLYPIISHACIPCPPVPQCPPHAYCQMPSKTMNKPCPQLQIYRSGFFYYFSHY